MAGHDDRPAHPDPSPSPGPPPSPAPEADPAVLRRAQRVLTGREHTRASLIDRLLAGGTSASAARAAADRLAASGLLDDRRAAAELLRRHLRRGPMPRAALRRRLEQAGVEPALAEHTIEAELAGHTDADLAVDAAERAVRTAGPRGTLDQQHRRLAAKLARLGFEADETRAAVEHVLGPIEG